MGRFNRFMFIILTQISTGGALFYAWEGFNWIEAGSGIHPMAAGAVATTLLLIPYLIRKYV